jgi:hypothetical protein
VGPIVLHIEGIPLERDADDEFRVRDLDLAERAGMAKPRGVRELIERNRAELEENGPICERPTVRRTQTPTGGEVDREVSEFWLTEAQAYNLVALMRTPMASKLRPLMARVFVQARRQYEAQQSSAASMAKRLLAAIVSPTPQDWELCFHDSLVRELAKLDGYDWNGGVHPRYLRSTNRKIYDMVFSSEVGCALKAKCPNPKNGDNLSQHLTSEARDYLRMQLRVVEAIARQSFDKADFWGRMAREYAGGLLQLSFSAVSEHPSNSA